MEKAMKAVQNIVVGAVAILVAALGYHYISSSGFEARISEIDERTESQAKEVERQGKQLQDTEVTIEDHAQRLEKLETEVDTAKKRLDEAEARLLVAKAQGDKNRQLFSALEEEVKRLKQDYDQSVQEIVALRKDFRLQQKINQEFDLRLRQLEKKAGISPVAP